MTEREKKRLINQAKKDYLIGSYIRPHVFSKVKEVKVTNNNLYFGNNRNLIIQTEKGEKCIWIEGKWCPIIAKNEEEKKLIDKAKAKYPVGTIFKTAHTNKTTKVLQDDYIKISGRDIYLCDSNNQIFGKREGCNHSDNRLIKYLDTWAKIVDEQKSSDDKLLDDKFQNEIKKGTYWKVFKDNNTVFSIILIEKWKLIDEYDDKNYYSATCSHVVPDRKQFKLKTSYSNRAMFKNMIPATNDEIAWLNKCIGEDKYVEKDSIFDYNKLYMHLQNERKDIYPIWAETGTPGNGEGFLNQIQSSNQKVYKPQGSQGEQKLIKDVNNKEDISFLYDDKEEVRFDLNERKVKKININI